MTDLTSMHSSMIIYKLDELLSSGHAIIDIVTILEGVYIVANYNLLISRGATNINLASLRDSVHPLAVINNFETFRSNNVPVDMANLLKRLPDDDYNIRSLESHEIVEWLKRGADPQELADKYLCSGGYDYEVAEVLIDAGAEIDTKRYIDNFKDDPEYYINKDEGLHLASVRDPSACGEIPMLRRAGASEAAIKKFEQWVANYRLKQEIAQYGGAYPKQLDINETGKQTKKIFFKPLLQVMSDNSGRTLESDWAGRVLPGQTLHEGVATELKAIYDFSGKFEINSIYFLDWAKDNKGNSIQRYGVHIVLFPEELSRDC